MSIVPNVIVRAIVVNIIVRISATTNLDDMSGTTDMTNCTIMAVITNNLGQLVAHPGTSAPSPARPVQLKQFVLVTSCSDDCGGMNGDEANHVKVSAARESSYLIGAKLICSAPRPTNSTSRNLSIARGPGCATAQSTELKSHDAELSRRRPSLCLSMRHNQLM